MLPSEPGQDLGGCFAEYQQDYSRQQCHADNNFNHAHNLTPLSGGFGDWNRPSPHLATSKRIITVTSHEFKAAFIFFTACKYFPRLLLKSNQTVDATRHWCESNVIIAEIIVPWRLQKFSAQIIILSQTKMPRDLRGEVLEGGSAPHL